MKYPELNEVAKSAHKNAKEKGFYDTKRDNGELFMLMVSELGEALEAHRKGKFSNIIDYSLMGEFDLLEYDAHIKGTFDEELADTAIRILDFCGCKELEINLNGYAEVGDFSLHPHANVGSELLEITARLCKARHAVAASNFVKTETVYSEILHEINASLIMLFELAELLEINLMWHIEAKMKYNATRPYKHAKAY